MSDYTTIPIAEARAHLSEVAEKVAATSDRVWLANEHGRPVAVIISLDDLSSLEEEIQLLRPPGDDGLLGELAALTAGVTGHLLSGIDLRTVVREEDGSLLFSDPRRYRHHGGSPISTAEVEILERLNSAELHIAITTLIVAGVRSAPWVQDMRPSAVEDFEAELGAAVAECVLQNTLDPLGAYVDAGKTVAVRTVEVEAELARRAEAAAAAS